MAENTGGKQETAFRTSRASEDAIEAEREEAAIIMESGPASGNRSGAWAFLAVAILAAGAVHFYFSDTGGDSYLYRLDAELLNHAELSLAALEDGSPLAVVPSWPLRMYAVLRRDIALYSIVTAIAAFAWGWATRIRARRDAYLVHQACKAELDSLRRRINNLENDKTPNPDRPENSKGQDRGSL